MSSPDPSHPFSAATGELRVQPQHPSFESDFADLAARFFSESGGGLSRQLSADLALEVVLNEIVEQSCLATGATGAAIVLQRDGVMVCRGSSGATAPELGSRLDAASGLSGECIRTLRTQRCDDVAVDPRADIEASQRLGVRSVMIVPILRGTDLVGVFELFSSLPYAFGDRDERTVEALVDRTLHTLERAADSIEPPSEVRPVAEDLVSPAQDSPQPADENDSGRASEMVTWALGAAVLACAILLGLLLGRHLAPQQARVRPRASTTSSMTTSSGAGSATAANTPVPNLPAEDNRASAATPQSAPNIGNPPVPPGGLLIYDNGREVFRMPPTRNAAEPTNVETDIAAEPATSIVPERTVWLPPATAESSVIHRVEPEYPNEARQQGVQGPVVLEVRIAADGVVEEVQAVNGPAQLVGSATAAVKQWRFRPRIVNGRRAKMETRITINFRLPQ
jgi:TonB family protein